MKPPKDRKVALPTNQEIERRYFEMFRRVYSLPPGDVHYADRPDVIVTGSRTVGISLQISMSKTGRIRGVNRCSIDIDKPSCRWRSTFTKRRAALISR